MGLCAKMPLLLMILPEKADPVWKDGENPMNCFPTVPTGCIYKIGRKEVLKCNMKRLY